MIFSNFFWNLTYKRQGLIGTNWQWSPPILRPLPPYLTATQFYSYYKVGYFCLLVYGGKWQEKVKITYLQKRDKEVDGTKNVSIDNKINESHTFFFKKKKRRDAYLRLLISSKANKFGREQTNVIIPGRIFESMLTKWSQ